MNRITHYLGLFWLMVLYSIITAIGVTIFEPRRPVRSTGMTLLVLPLVFLEVYHLAGHTRSRCILLFFGCLNAMLIGAEYVSQNQRIYPLAPSRDFEWLVARDILIAVVLIVLVGAATLLIARWRWHQDRPASGPPLCSKCGYDLRASQDRCPECGTPMTTTGKEA